MNRPLERPAPILAAGPGLLRKDHFQIAYATNDIDRACDVFARRYGITEFARLEGQMPAGGHIRIELAWVGPTMFELLTASGPGSAVYMDRLPAGDGFAMRHHHLGFMISSQAEWDALLAEVREGGFSMPHINPASDFMLNCFVDSPELGHYLEYVFPTARGLAFLQGVPAVN